MAILISNGDALVDPQELAETTNAQGEKVQHYLLPDPMATGTLSAFDAVAAAPAGAGALVSGASTAGSIVSLITPGGDAAWTVQLTGTFGTGGTVYFEASLNSTNGTDGDWINVNARQAGVINTTLSGNATTAGIYRGNTSGFKYFRVRLKGTSGTPSVGVLIRLSSGQGATFLNASLPAGSNNIGWSNGRPGTYVDTSFTASGVAYAGTTEAAVSLTPVTDAVAAAPATSFSVPAASTQRLQTIFIAATNGAATATVLTFNLRAVPTGGTLSNTSPILWTAQVALPATAASITPLNPPALFLPDGKDLKTGWIWGLYNVASVASAGTTLRVTAVGYRY